MGRVTAVCARRGHHFSKTPALSIRLLAGLGVEGDGHMGATVQHRYDRRRENQPLHYIHSFGESGHYRASRVPVDVSRDCAVSSDNPMRRAGVRDWSSRTGM